MNPHALDPLASKATIQEFDRDELIVRTGERSDALFVVLDGEVRISRPAPNSGSIELGTRTKGEVIGEIAVIDGEARTADMTAKTPTRCGVIGRQDFLTFLHEHPKVTVGLLGVVGSRQRGTMDQIGELAHAYHDLEAKNGELETQLGRGRRARRRSMVALAGLLVTIQLLFWAWSESGGFAGLVGLVEQTINALNGSVEASDEPAVNDVPQTIAVTTEPLEQTIDLIGRIEPGDRFDLTAPFDAIVTELNFSPGNRVERGEVLARLSTKELEANLRTAEVGFIEAQQQLNQLNNWETGPAVSDSQRNLAAARERVSEAEQLVLETQNLFDIGIVSEQELKQVRKQLTEAGRVFAAAEQSLNAVLEQGSSDNRRVAELKFTNAEAELQDLRDLLEQSVVRAPTSGLALEPPSSSQDGGGGNVVAIGTRVVAQQVFLSVGDMELLRIQASVSELDVDAVRPDLVVDITTEITGDEVMRGYVEAVGSQATPESEGQPLAQYPVTVRLQSMSTRQRQKLRIGMRANMRVVLYRNERAMVVPHSSVVARENSASVWRVDPSMGTIEEVAVAVGQSLTHGLEIISGIADGDEILIDAAALSIDG